MTLAGPFALGGNKMIVTSVRRFVEHRPLAQINPDASVRDACHVLDRLNVGALAVLTGEHLQGVLSERDVIRKCICQSRLTADTRVSEIMTADPVTIDAGEPPARALKLMTAGRFRHLPIVDGGKVVGLLSIRDIPAEYHLMFERFGNATRDGRQEAGRP